MRKLCLRPMGEKDLTQVMQIEKDTFFDPWNYPLYRDCLQSASCWVLEQNGVVHAYGVISMEGTEAHILNLCVRSQSRRHGLGRRMLVHLLNHAHGCGAEIVLLEVRLSNQTAIELYYSMGFRKLAIRKASYRTAQGREDALVLATRFQD